MLDHLRKQSGLISTLLVLLILAVGIYLFQFVWQFLLFFSDIIVILVIAWVLSFILGPFVEGLHDRLRFPRSISALLIYTLFFGLLALTIFLFVPVVSSQVQSLTKELPKYQRTFPTYVNKLTALTVSLADNSLSLIPGVAGVLFDGFLVLITSFYFVLDKERINREIYTLLPRKWHDHAHYVQDLIDSTFGSFLRMQIIFGIVAGIATWIIMSAFGLPYGASSSLVAGLLTIIPLIGGLLALVPPVLIAFLIDPARAVLVLITLIAMQQIIFNIVAPRLMGRALKLHPVVVLFSFLIGYKVAGGFGVIFAIPVLGVLFVILHNLSHHYLEQK